MAVKVAFMQLSDCWGCHQSLLDAHLGLLGVLPALDIVYWPAVVDYKLASLKARKAGEIVVGFVEGAVRTEADLALAKVMREKCQIIIAFGSCACYGNVQGMANQWDIEECKKSKFMQTESIADGSGKIPTKHVPKFMDKIVPLDKYINIDAYMAGCPPKTEQIISAVLFLLGQKPFPMKDLAFCNTCDLNSKGCLLEKGMLCFGPITSTGCALKCTSRGDPCVGCFGPSKTVHIRADKLSAKTKTIDKASQSDKKSIYEFLSLFLNVPLMAGFDLPADILKQIKIKGKVMTPLANLPPSTMEVANNALNLLKTHPDFHNISTVCDTCPRTVRSKSKMTEVKRDFIGLPNMEDCFIEQGYICVGPTTKAGCGGLCIRVNAPCTGCYGQTKWVADQAARFAEVATKNFNVGLSKDELLKQIKDPIGTFQKYTLAANKDFKGGK